MANISEEKCIDALKEILVRCFGDENKVVVGDYAECATCLEKQDEGWDLYHGERLNHYNSQFFGDIKDACLAAIDKAGYPEDMQEAKNEFLRVCEL